MRDTSIKGKGLEMPFIQAIAETANKTGYRVSSITEERYNSNMQSITGDGTDYTGAVVVRLTPAE